VKQVQFDGLDEAALALKSLVECANFDRYLRSVTALRYGHISLRPIKYRHMTICKTSKWL